MVQKQNSMRIIATSLIGSILLLSGCSSVSYDTAHKLRINGEVVTAQCESSMSTVAEHEKLKWGRNIATPILTVATVGLAPIIIGANAALDYVDRKNASNMLESCGKNPLNEEQILADVGTNAMVNVALGAVDVGGVLSPVSSNAAN